MDGERTASEERRRAVLKATGRGSVLAIPPRSQVRKGTSPDLRLPAEAASVDVSLRHA
jgi:hypothetical protein